MWLSERIRSTGWFSEHRHLSGIRRFTLRPHDSGPTVWVPRSERYFTIAVNGVKYFPRSAELQACVDQYGERSNWNAANHYKLDPAHVERVLRIIGTSP